MTRKTVAVVTTDKGRKPDYNSGFDDAVYWDDGRELAEELSEGEVSIIPHDKP
jgi:hypothetical protein